MDYSSKRAFNLLWGVNQGCGLLLARDLEKRESVSWLTPLRRLNAVLWETIIKLKKKKIRTRDLLKQCFNLT